MPDRRTRLLSGLFAVIGGGALFAAPVVGAAPQDWEGSAFSEGTTSAHQERTFAIAGSFSRTKAPRELADRRIQDVNLEFSFRDGEEVAFDPGCIPDATINADVQEEETFDTSTRTSTRTFRLPPGFEWNCNGTFALVARATASPADTYDLTGTIRVGVPPEGVSTMKATVVGGDKAPDPATGATADDPASVKVIWDQLADPHAQYPDFAGYRVQRAGPAGDGTFATVGDPVVAHDGEKTTREFTDTIEAPGEYRYRVQSLRAGPDGTAPDQLVPSADDTPSVGVEIAGPPATTTTAPPDGPPTTRRSLELPDVGRGTNNPRTSLTVPSPPTTLDTGFEDTLDYGELPEPGDELAGEGQSVIRNESEGAGLLGPVAGAMVLLGWAGHVAYLNRLAKQF